MRDVRRWVPLLVVALLLVVGVVLGVGELIALHGDTSRLLTAFSSSGQSIASGSPESVQLAAIDTAITGLTFVVRVLATAAGLAVLAILLLVATGRRHVSE